MAHNDSASLIEIADGVFAHLAGDAGWGWSNAGLICGEGQSLLVDTLFDLELTSAMLDTMARHTGDRPIRQLVNTHANGDHCYGNELVTGAEIIGSNAARDELEALPPSALAAMTRGGFGQPLDSYLEAAFGPFTFDDITVTPPTRTFDQQLQVDAGGRIVELYEVGPAHTAGDVIAHLPDAGIVFTGDILFIEGTPIIWDGPVSNWIAACDRIDSFAATAIVPGHGPVTDSAGVAQVREYLRFVHEQASACHRAGLSVADAARSIDIGPYRDWSDWERIAINVDAVYREIDVDYAPASVMDLFATMAEMVQS